MKTVLVTGFGPFLDVAVNASGLVALEVAQVRDDVHAEVLPTAFASREVVKELVNRLRPTVVVSIGVSRDPFVRLERRATGTVTSAHPDVTGAVWAGTRMGEDRCGSGIDRWIVDVRAIDPSVAPSDDAGGYVCNALYHAVLEATDRPATFVHIPRATEPEAIAHCARIIGALVDAMLRDA